MRDKLVDPVRTPLSPHGVVYISYNALLGCRIGEMFRHMMLFHARGETHPEPLIGSAREFLEYFVAAQTALGPAGTFIKDEAGPVLLYHDELAQLYDPIYFHQFVSGAARHGLQFLSEANYFDMQPGRFQGVMQQIERFSGGNRILREHTRIS